MVMEVGAKAGRSSCGGAGGIGGGQLSAWSPLTIGHAWGVEKTWMAIQGLR